MAKFYYSYHSGVHSKGIWGIATTYTKAWFKEFLTEFLQIADLRVYTKDKEKVMDIINEADLLEKSGKWQLINCKSILHAWVLVSPLISSLKQHRGSS